MGCVTIFLFFISDRRCVEPDITNGQVTIVDAWENGFAGLIEFSDVNRVSREGWSVLVTFNQNMGPVRTVMLLYNTS